MKKNAVKNIRINLGCSYLLLLFVLIGIDVIHLF